jgi:hypothetical protein
MNPLCKLLPIAALCGSVDIPGDLSVYDGRTPFQEVQGYRLFDVPRVDLNLRLYAGDDGRDFLDDLDQSTTITLRDGALIVGLCERGNCAANNATVAIARDGSLIALCTYSRDDDHGARPGTVHWVGPQLNKLIPYRPDEACPQEPDFFIDRYASLRR